MAQENDPHGREYAGAIAGMHDAYGFPVGCTLPSAGDRIAYRLKTHTETESEAGRVVRVSHDADGPLLVVQPEGGDPKLVIDGRPWPTGNLMPY